MITAADFLDSDATKSWARAMALLPMPSHISPEAWQNMVQVGASAATEALATFYRICAGEPTHPVMTLLNASQLLEALAEDLRNAMINVENDAGRTISTIGINACACKQGGTQ